MLARGQGETTLAERAFASIPDDWERLLIVQEEPDSGWRALAKKHHVRVEVVPFKNFATSKNAGLDAVRTDWVFVLDWDETLTFGLRDEIQDILKAPEYNGYYVPRANKVLGAVVRHGGWYPDHQLKLFRPSLGRYVGEVHELIKTTEELGYLRQDLQHDNIRSLEQYHAKIDHYTNFEAEILFKAGRRPTALYLIGKPIREFFSQYVWRRGYRDGVRGLIVAGMSAYYRFLAGAKLWEKLYSKEK